MEQQKSLTQQEKALSLFAFIRELNKLKQKVVRNWKEYPLCRPMSGFPKDPEHIQVFYRDREVEDADEAEQGNVLLAIRKPWLEPCPKPGQELEDWLIEGWESLHNEPQAHAFKSYGKPERLEWFDEEPQRVSAFRSWKEKRDVWAQRQQILTQSLELFNDLYKRYFELERNPETLEMIVANGILMDRCDPEVCHPVLTKRVRLCFDPDENIITIEEVEGQSELYSVLLQTMNDINHHTVNQLREELGRNDYHPLDRNETPDFFKSLIHQLSSDSQFCADGVPADWKKQERLLLYLDPCFILRHRLDGTPKAIERIIEHIRETGIVPAPIGDIVSGGMVEIPDQTAEQSLEEQLAAVGGESAHILLSKEANSEQLEIAKRIGQYNAVLVQGPPGTGKTHTIANLMGHFLAQGQSVLVTSHTPKALSVLKEKVPKGLRNLCVSVLEDSNVDMERSVDGIAEYMSRITSRDLRREMEVLEQERELIIDQLAQVRQRLFALIRQECTPIPWQGAELSASAAARFVLDHQDSLSYIPGKIDRDQPLPLSRTELLELYRSNEDLTEAEDRELALGLPERGEMLSPMEMEELLTNLNSRRRQLEELHCRQNWFIIDNGIETRLTLQNGKRSFDIDQPDRASLENLLQICTTFEEVQPWMKCAAVDGREDGAYRRRWELLIEQIRATCALNERVMESRFGHEIELGDFNPEQGKASLEKLRALFAEKKRLSKLTLMFHKDCERLLAQISFDGRPLASAGECEVVLGILELEESRKKCARYWEELLIPQGVVRFAELDRQEPERTAANWIGSIERYLNWYGDAFIPFRDRLKKCQIPESAVFGITELDSRLMATDKILSAVSRDIPDICRLVLAMLEQQECEKQLGQARAVLLSGGRVASELCADAALAIENRDTARYAQCCAQLEQVCEKNTLRHRRKELLGRLSIAAPQWAEDIRRRKGIHGEALVPDTIEDAWKWKQLSQIVADIVAEPYAKLQDSGMTYSRRYREITAAYAEKAAWYHLMRRTEGNVDMRQALLGWKQTIKKIGKGTGKNAPALKAKARELMSRCQEAVPGWIMPMGRALENLDPRRNSFDIIIIDEASQSDVSSLAILYMGKKLIIVGDDKQVSPMAVGVEVDKMSALQQMYIQDKIPNSHLYDAKTSIYDIAKTTFQPLMLREHFRCVPQIIGFSNLLSYDDQIKPLREAGSSVLLPAVVSHRVADGLREEKRKINPAEAREIVALMCGCIAQPEYAGKTFGIISLLGDEQVKRIQMEIEQCIDPCEIIERRILCGNASQFQGDERDVIFLSMVDSGRVEGMLHLQGFGVDDAVRKRYNVAASRARDQLWVVHSLDAARNLKPGDIRKILLDYAANPDAGLEEQMVQKAETPFAAAIAEELKRRGYHLERQRCVGAYHLDMVAVCGSRTVAIECDGERPDSGEHQIRADMERQTILQRLGWRFIRIRGSEYYRDPKKCMTRVVQELEACDIHPEENAPVAIAPQDLLNRVRRHARELLTV